MNSVLRIALIAVVAVAVVKLLARFVPGLSAVSAYL